MLCDKCRKHFKQPDLIKYDERYLCMECIGNVINEEKVPESGKVKKFFDFLYDKICLFILRFYYKF